MKISELQRGDIWWLSEGLKKVALGPAFPHKAINDGKYVDSFGVNTISLKTRRNQIDWRDEGHGYTQGFGLQCPLTIGTDEISPMLTVVRDGKVLQEGTG